ncbi:MAG: hypothetical protein LQ340_007594 [Diploschistes diacapsis]|nr:MAG: hypothetical protein LQ340_007594 [Diploschistes diacapsis]
MSRFLTSRSLRTAFSPRLHGLPASRSSRPLSTSLARQYPRKDSQDRESMNTDAAEYSKSGSDDIAAHKDVAFDSGTVKPEEALGKAEEEEGVGNPLDVSPANHDVSKPRGDNEGAPEASARAVGQESGYPGGSAGGRGSPSKGKKIT